MPPARSVPPENHPAGCYVCGGSGPLADVTLDLDSVGRSWDLNMCGTCRPVAVPLLARMFQEHGEGVQRWP